MSTWHHEKYEAYKFLAPNLKATVCHSWPGHSWFPLLRVTGKDHADEIYRKNLPEGLYWKDYLDIADKELSIWLKGLVKNL